MRCSRRGQPAGGQPVHRLTGRGRAVDPRRGNDDQRVEIPQHLLGDGGVHGGAAVDDRDREVAVETRRRLAIDRGIQHTAARRGRLARENEQARRVVTHPAAHIGERLEVLVGRQFPVGALRLRVDAAAQLAERGVGVDGHHPVVLAQLGEHRPDTGRHGRLPDAALAHHADLEVPAQRRLDLVLQLGLADLVGRLAEIDHSEGGLVQREPPTAAWRNPACGHKVIGPDSVGVGRGRRRRGRVGCVTLGRPGLTRPGTRRLLRRRSGLSRRTRRMRRLPLGRLTPRTVVGTVGGGHRPCVARRSRRRAVSGRRLTETAARRSGSRNGGGGASGGPPRWGGWRHPAPWPLRRAASAVRARRSPPAGATAQEASAEAAVRPSVSAARSRFPRGPSSRGLSAMRRRGRSLQISFGVRRRGCRPLSSINHAGPAPSHTRSQGAPKPTSKHLGWALTDPCRLLKATDFRSTGW